MKKSDRGENMKKMIPIKAAEDDSKLQQSIPILKDDFDYILSGLDKLDRINAESSNEGLIIAERLSNTFQEIISDIADKM